MYNMADPPKPVAKKKPKSSKIYSCSQCSYKTNRAYNVQRHLVKHLEKPPRELQHICTHPGCSFSSMRWDNLNRHIQRLHQVSEAIVEEPETIICDEIETEPMDEDSSLIPSEEELASYLSDEIIEEVEPEEPPETIPTKVPKVNKVVKQNEKRVVKPRKTYKSGKTKYYECVTCNYRTNRGYNIKRHVAKHRSTTELLLHVCVIAGCGFSSPRWDNLRRHVKRIHPESFVW